MSGQVFFLIIFVPLINTTLLDVSPQAHTPPCDTDIQIGIFWEMHLVAFVHKNKTVKLAVKCTAETRKINKFKKLQFVVLGCLCARFFSCQ